MPDVPLLVVVFFAIAYPTYVLLMAGVLRAVGVPRDQIAKWALHQAHRQPLPDLLRAARGLAPPPPPEAREPRLPSE